MIRVELEIKHPVGFQIAHHHRIVFSSKNWKTENVDWQHGAAPKTENSLFVPSAQCSSRKLVRDCMRRYRRGFSQSR
jgi:hypothetical protein